MVTNVSIPPLLFEPMKELSRNSGFLYDHKVTISLHEDDSSWYQNHNFFHKMGKFNDKKTNRWHVEWSLF